MRTLGTLRTIRRFWSRCSWCNVDRGTFITIDDELICQACRGAQYDTSVFFRVYLP